MFLRFHMPTKVIIGPQSVVENGAEFAALGKSCLIVTGKTSAKVCGALDDAITALEKAGVQYRIFDEITQNPYLSTCVKGGKLAHEMGADFILGIGGGSPLDAAKAVAVFATNPTLAPDTVFARNWAADPLPIALIGTTSGTGSEVTQYAVMTLDESHRKSSIADPRCFARVAFGDPRYTSSLSARFSISTGLDALSHCLEGYFNKTADGCSDLFALEGAKLAAHTLAAIAGKTPEEITLEEREALYTASIYAGITIARTGTAYCHALGYFLTEEHDMPHGFACAALLPSYLEESRVHMPCRLPALEGALGMSVQALSDLIVGLTKDAVTLPVLTGAEIETLARRFDGNGNLKKSPGNVDVEKTISLLGKIFG